MNTNRVLLELLNFQLSAFLVVILTSSISPLWAADELSAPPSATGVEKSATASPAVAFQQPPGPAPDFNDATASRDKQTRPDPTGRYAGVCAAPHDNGNGDVPSALTPGDLYNRIVHNLFSINVVWTLMAGFFVLFMQAGFAMLDTGLCRSKNASNTITMALMVFALGSLGFWAYGFALGWGNWSNGPAPPGWHSTLGPGAALLNSGIGLGAAPDAAGNPSGAYAYGLLGTKGFFLAGLDDVSVMALFFFMMVLMNTAAIIPIGAMAERWSWKNFCIYGLWIALPFSLYANWIWGGGWLARAGLNWNLGHGAVDFAGSGVVHAMGGVIGLAGAMALGPRIGKYSKDGKALPIPGHHTPMVIIGTFILAFGWLGLNSGAALAGADLRISAVVVNTALAGVAGTLGALLALNCKGMKPDPSMMCNGMLAGLVAITAPCAFVDTWAAVLIGGIAGVIVVFSVFFWDHAKIDDPVGAISVHGVNGLWGLVSLGLFANGKYGAGWNGVVRDEFVKAYGADGVRGLFFGDPSQFLAQIVDALVVALFAFAMAYACFKLSNIITPIRVSRETEMAGLDGPEMGAMGYPDFFVGGNRA